MKHFQEIYDIVRCIPYGCVVSYGRIARMVKCNPRQVGYAMAAITDEMDLPWHRVINSKGEISLRKYGTRDRLQRQLLLEEDIVFDHRGRIDFDRYGWVTVESDGFCEDGFAEPLDPFSTSDSNDQK